MTDIQPFKYKISLNRDYNNNSDRPGVITIQANDIYLRSAPAHIKAVIVGGVPSEQYWLDDQAIDELMAVLTALKNGVIGRGV